MRISEKIDRVEYLINLNRDDNKDELLRLIREIRFYFDEWNIK